MSEGWNKGFLKTKKTLSERFAGLFKGSIDEDLYEELIETLVLSDIPYVIAEQIVENAKEKLTRSEKSDEHSVRSAVKQSALELISAGDKFEGIDFPAVILVTGVNGAGKTTTIAKLAGRMLKDGKSVILAAADTFRAAASDQLDIWAQRLGVPIVKSMQGQDAAGVVFDALQSAKAKRADALICDTAGRLQSKKNLMNELEKIYRVCEKNRGEYNLYTILVLDAMSGQNSIAQLESFSEYAKPNGIILTKTDGSAKGGVLLGIAAKGNASVWYVGTGEAVDDLEEFDAVKYIDAIFG